MFPLEQEVVLQSDDIIIERAAPYGLEIMVCDKVIELEPKPGRLNSAVYVKDQVFPVIIIEAFDLATPTLLPVRFERLNPLIEGENLFFDHQGRI